MLLELDLSELANLAENTSESPGHFRELVYADMLQPELCSIPVRYSEKITQSRINSCSVHSFLRRELDIYLGGKAVDSVLEAFVFHHVEKFGSDSFWEARHALVQAMLELSCRFGEKGAEKFAEQVEWFVRSGLNVAAFDECAKYLQSADGCEFAG